MTDALKHIYLSWRKGRSSRRHIVGLLNDIDNHQVRFSYLNDGVQRAREEGFQGYTEFSDFGKEYDSDVLDVFAQRLTPTVRLNKSSYIVKFWEIPSEKLQDKWSILAYTQGLLSTDNFELLADFEAYEGLCFISDLAGLSHIDVPVDLLQNNDELQWDYDSTNEYDSRAVLVYKAGQQIGYVKKIHCNIFHKWSSERIRISVHAIEKNGVVKNIFVKIFLV